MRINIVNKYEQNFAVNKNILTFALEMQTVVFVKFIAEIPNLS